MENQHAGCLCDVSRWRRLVYSREFKFDDVEVSQMLSYDMKLSASKQRKIVISIQKCF